MDFGQLSIFYVIQLASGKTKCCFDADKKVESLNLGKVNQVNRVSSSVVAVGALRGVPLSMCHFTP